MKEDDPYRFLSILSNVEREDLELQVPKLGKIVPKIDTDILERRVKQIILRTYRTIFFEVFVKKG